MMRISQRTEKDYLAIYGGSKFDLLKIILAFMIIVLHCNILPPPFKAILRVAVPLFFMMTSYFFFNRVKNLDKASTEKSLVKYISRNAMLYLFWFLILFPIAYSSHISWHSGYLFDNYLHFWKSFLFTGLFPASWFIPAAVIGMIIVYELSKFMSNVFLLLVGFLCYFLCLADSSYYYLFEDNVLIKNILNVCHFFFGSCYLSFIQSIVWIVLGKILAESPMSCRLNHRIYFGLSVIMLTAESLLVKKLYLFHDDACYLSLLPICLFLFVIIGESSISVKYNEMVRRISIILYCVHLSIINVLRDFSLLNNYQILFVTILLSLFISMLILWLERYPAFKWLKYAH